MQIGAFGCLLRLVRSCHMIVPSAISLLGEMDEATFLDLITNIAVAFSSNIVDAISRMSLFTRWTILTLFLVLWLASFSTIIYYVEYDLDYCLHGGCQDDTSRVTIDEISPSYNRKNIRVSIEDKMQSPNKNETIEDKMQSANKNETIEDNLQPTFKYENRSIIRRMNETSNPIYFLHIGKSGGSSIDKIMRRLNKSSNKLYWGFNHFDWSYIEMHHAKHIQNTQRQRKKGQRLGEIQQIPELEQRQPVDVGQTADVITFLRNPVSRSISQFYFGQTLPWAKKANATFITQTLEEYVYDKNKTWLQPLSDGEGGVDFLAGIFHDGGWVMTDGLESESKEFLRRNKTAACLVAAQRLEQTVWFGLLEDVERSMILLQHSLVLDKPPLLPKFNSARKKYPIPSDEIKLEIEKQLPKDMWLYKFAKRLFEARWNYFMGVNGVHEYKPPELPPLEGIEVVY